MVGIARPMTRQGKGIQPAMGVSRVVRRSNSLCVYRGGQSKKHCAYIKGRRTRVIIGSPTAGRRRLGKLRAHAPKGGQWLNSRGQRASNTAQRLHSRGQRASNTAQRIGSPRSSPAVAVTTPKSSASDRMIAPGLPAVKRWLLESILANECIDLTELPPAKGRSKIMPNSLEGKVLLVHETDFQQTYPGHKHLDSVLLSVHGYCGPLLSHIYAYVHGLHGET